MDELSERGHRQAERFGARILTTEVTDLGRGGELFVAHTASGIFRARAVILATGVSDRWAEFPGYEAYIGRSMHWCIVCDGFEMQGKRILVVGNDDHAAEMATQLMRFAEQVTLLTNDDHVGIPRPALHRLERDGIPVVVDRLVGARARDHGFFAAVLLAGGDEIEIDHLFSAQGAVPNTGLARSLGVALNEEEYIKVDTEARTSVPGVYAAGDVTRLFSHQIATAVHEGATAATALNYALYRQDEEQAR